MNLPTDLCEYEGFSFTTSRDTRFVPLSFFTLFWLLSIGFFWPTGEFERLDDKLTVCKQGSLSVENVNDESTEKKVSMMMS